MAGAGHPPTAGTRMDGSQTADGPSAPPKVVAGKAALRFRTLRPLTGLAKLITFPLPACPSVAAGVSAPGPGAGQKRLFRKDDKRKAVNYTINYCYEMDFV